MKEVAKRGKGAYNTNLGSVRLKEDYSKNDDLRKGKSKRLSAEQWSKARVCSFFYKSIFQCMRYKNKTWIYMMGLNICINLLEPIIIYYRNS